MALAEAELATGDVAAALQAISQGLELSSRDAQSVPAALTYIAAGELDRAREIAAALGSQLQPTSRAYGMMIESLVLLEEGEQVLAIDKLTAALNLADLWLVRYYRGRAYLAAGFATEAMDEFSAITERNGEATAVFLDDLPTYRYMADVSEWLGRAQDGLGL
jgi:tetratricopeptide (TPR) repeat protein